MGEPDTLYLLVYAFALTLSMQPQRIRLYGADCNLTALVLEAIKQTKVDLTVTIAIYVVDGDPAAYDRQKTAIQDALTKYDTSKITGITGMWLAMLL